MKNIVTTLIAAVAFTVIAHIGFTCAQVQNNNVSCALENLREPAFEAYQLENWAEPTCGNRRVAIGWKVEKDVIQTEDGAFWSLNTDEIGDENLLIWFDDMGTPTSSHDDQIIKVWRAVYN